MDFKKIFAERVRKKRQEAGLTQVQLGEAVGLSKQAINNIEAGLNETRIDRAIAIARCLGTTVEYLGGYTDDSGRTDNPETNK